MRGHSGYANFNKLAGERTRMNLNVGYRSPGFEINDLGFQRRADQIPQSSWLQIRWDKPGKYTRNIRLNFNQWSSHNFAGDRLELGGNINLHGQFVNLWSSGGGINFNARNFDDRLTRGGPGGYTLPNMNGWYYLNTDDRRKVSVNWNFNFYRTSRSHGYAVEPRIVIRPTPAFSAEFGHLFDKGLQDAQWVTEEVIDERPHYVFARLDQKTSSMTIRANYTVTPNLSVQVYAQPFVSSGSYANYKELVNGRAEDYDDRFAPYPYTGTPDFKVLSFRTTNVMRWEYKPGSTLFVVWQQGREGNGAVNGFRYGQDFGDVFATPSSNALLVKLAYWLNP
jgi:hypothetical protein